MAVDELQVSRVRALRGTRSFTERRMFGGVAFFLDDRVVCCVLPDMLLLRVGRDREEVLLADPRARRFEMRGKPTRGWVTIDMRSLDDGELGEWVRNSVNFVSAMSAPVVRQRHRGRRSSADS